MIFFIGYKWDHRLYGMDGGEVYIWGKIMFFTAAAAAALWHDPRILWMKVNLSPEVLAGAITVSIHRKRKDKSRQTVYNWLNWKIHVHLPNKQIPESHCFVRIYSMGDEDHWASGGCARSAQWPPSPAWRGKNPSWQLTTISPGVMTSRRKVPSVEGGISVWVNRLTKLFKQKDWPV